MTADDLIAAAAGAICAALAYLLGRVDGHRRGWKLACELNAAVHRAQSPLAEVAAALPEAEG